MVTVPSRPTGAFATAKPQSKLKRGHREAHGGSSVSAGTGRDRGGRIRGRSPRGGEAARHGRRQAGPRRTRPRTAHRAWLGVGRDLRRDAARGARLGARAGRAEQIRRGRAPAGQAARERVRRPARRRRADVASGDDPAGRFRRGSAARAAGGLPSREDTARRLASWRWRSCRKNCHAGGSAPARSARARKSRRADHANGTDDQKARWLPRIADGSSCRRRCSPNPIPAGPWRACARGPTGRRTAAGGDRRQDLDHPRRARRSDDAAGAHRSARAGYAGLSMLLAERPRGTR
jgi:hypothetical protein